jgi:hypothetical protein
MTESAGSMHSVIITFSAIYTAILFRCFRGSVLLLPCIIVARSGFASSSIAPIHPELHRWQTKRKRRLKTSLSLTFSFAVYSPCRMRCIPITFNRDGNSGRYSCIHFDQICSSDIWFPAVPPSPQKMHLRCGLRGNVVRAIRYCNQRRKRPPKRGRKQSVSLATQSAGRSICRTSRRRTLSARPSARVGSQRGDLQFLQKKHNPL